MTRRPRREWKSFVWVARCSVSFWMRSLRMATWTSGEPVSPSLRAYWEMISCLRATLIDIGIVSFELRYSAHAGGGFPQPRLRRALPACRPALHRPLRRRRFVRGTPGFAGRTASRTGRNAGLLPGPPSGRAPGCRPAPSRAEADARKRPDYARERPNYPGKSPARVSIDRPRDVAIRQRILGFPALPRDRGQGFGHRFRDRPRPRKPRHQNPASRSIRAA